ncbi:hypothetical protein C8Q74DRAFT_1367203 [Fomes fomentarius]|nr:hypothetical protein C8Q74DRAFT_1367203 [Fomes fomentarius]
MSAGKHSTSRPVSHSEKNIVVESLATPSVEPAPAPAPVQSTPINPFSSFDERAASCGASPAPTGASSVNDLFGDHQPDIKDPLPTRAPARIEAEDLQGKPHDVLDNCYAKAKKPTWNERVRIAKACGWSTEQVNRW